MVLRLHVWGPAFGLASIDAECLAAITYLASVLPNNTEHQQQQQQQQQPWELVATSPSAVPTHCLPALHDTTANTWTTGYAAITALLPPSSSSSPSQEAHTTTYTTFLTTHARPLLATSLYLSSANWSHTTRPAYSTILPFPLPWTEPLRLRAQMCDAAAHLGLDDLNIDDTASSSSHPDQDTRGFLKVPERLRPRPTGVKARLSPEQTALFRLDALARECLDVLDADGVLGGGGESAGDEATTTTTTTTVAVDCLAFGYLALMLAPEVPRPWLRDVLRSRYETLCLFVDRVRDRLYGGDALASLPWRDAEQPSRVTRLARGVLEVVVPAAADLMCANDAAACTGKRSGPTTRGGSVAAAAAAAAGLGVVGSLVLYLHLMPFGSVIHRWERQRSPFGAVGVFLGL